MDNNILTILTTDDRNEIKKALKDIIIERIKDDIKDYDSYIFDPDELQEMMIEAIEEVKGQIKPLLKELMFNEMKSKLGIE